MMGLFGAIFTESNNKTLILWIRAHHIFCLRSCKVIIGYCVDSACCCLRCNEGSIHSMSSRSPLLIPPNHSARSILRIVNHTRNIWTHSIFIRTTSGYFIQNNLCSKFFSIPWESIRFGTIEFIIKVFSLIKSWIVRSSDSHRIACLVNQIVTDYNHIYLEPNQQNFQWL